MNKVVFSIALFLAATVLGNCAKQPEAVKLFSEGKARAYLNVSDHTGLEQPLADLQRCFSEMTGKPLPSKSLPLLLDPTLPQPLRVECRVTKITDRSKNASDNGTVSLLLSPVTFFAGGPFSVAGQKVGWDCTWHRNRKQYEMRLTIAKDAYYGPGYGPFTFEKIVVDGVDPENNPDLRLAIEMRDANGADIRGGYSVDGRSWIYTEWYDPTKAGTDTSVPGASDKNGPQAWPTDWTRNWKNLTAVFVTGYAPVDRDTQITVDNLLISQAGKTLLNSKLSTKQNASGFFITPSQGSVSFTTEGAVLSPALRGYYTVGLRLNRAANIANLIPINIKYKPMPKGASYMDYELQQGYEIVVNKKQILLQAYTKLGIQNAVYSLLDRWGCRWVMPGELGEEIPKRKSLSLNIGTIKSPKGYDNGPDGSTSWSGDRDILTWYDRNMGGRNHSQNSSHYWHYAMPPSKYFKDHPDWYALIGGKRVPSQLCTSNPEVIAKMTEFAKDYLKRLPNSLNFPMDPEDNMEFCQCANCTAIDPPGRGSDGLPLLTDRVIAFCNAVAEGIREEFPNRKIGVLAYSNHIMPPVTVKPADNVIVTICRSNSCNLHLLPVDGCPTAKDFYKIVEGWSKLTKNINIYEYDPISWIGSLPCPTYMDHARALSLLHNKYGVRGGVVDRVPYTMERNPSIYINYYMERRIKTDPRRNPEKELLDMCQSFFGPAGKYMNLYYLELAKATQSTHPGRSMVGMGLYRYHEFFNRKMISNARSYIDKALSVSAGKEKYSERVKLIDTSQQYLEAYLNGVWSAMDKDYEASVATFDRADKIIDQLAAANAIDSEDAHWRIHCARMKTLAEHFADKLGYVRQWKLLGPFDNNAMDADFKTDSFEPISNIAAPVVASNGKEYPWNDYTSPEGMLNLEEAYKNAEKPGRLSYSYMGLTVVSPRAMQVHFRMDSFFAFRVFVNGKEVFHRPGLNADCPDRQVAQVNLRAGENTVVFKSSQTCVSTDSFPWGIFFRMTDPSGEPILYTSTEGARLLIDAGKISLPIVEFPAQWKFAKDPDNRGTESGWHTASYDDSSWQTVPVPDYWDNTTGPYNGYAWYRIRFTLPAEAEGVTANLRFEGVDEQAWVYLNGKKIGERSIESTGKTIDQIWDQPFNVPLENALFGAENVLAVKVHNTAYAGGIFKPVNIVKVNKDN